MKPPLWYYVRDGKQVGPVEAVALFAEIDGRRTTREDLVWCQGMPAWVPAGQAEELKEAFQPKPTPPPLPNALMRQSPPQTIPPPRDPVLKASVVEGSGAAADRRDLSALLEMHPESINDNTDQLDLSQLRVAKKEASKALRRESKATARTVPARSLHEPRARIGMAVGLIILIAAAFASWFFYFAK